MQQPFKVTEEKITRADGGKVAIYRWEAGEKTPLCVMAHGLGEYGARYRRLVGDLTGTGWSFAAFDFRGHGHSDGARMRMRSPHGALEDIEAVLDHVRQGAAKNRPVVLFGHSFGGLAAARYAATRPHNLRALILSSPAFGIYPSGPCINLAVRLLYRLKPDLVLKKPVLPDRLTHDPAVHKEYLTDPFIYKFVGIDFMYNMVKSMGFAGHEGRLVHIPVLMILAGDERIVDNKAGDAFFESISSADKERYTCEGFYHETFNELKRDEPIGVLKTFLERIKKSL